MRLTLPLPLLPHRLLVLGLLLGLGFSPIGEAKIRECLRQELVAISPPEGLTSVNPIYWVPAAASNGVGDLEPRKLFESFQDELVIGITEPRHYFAWIGGKQFDGDIIKMPLAGAIPQKTGRLMLVRFPDLPPETIAKARSVMERHMKSATLTCVHSACRILHESGIQLADGKGEPVFLGEGFERILQHGFKDKYGRPVRAEVFFHSASSTIDQLYSELTRTDRVLTRWTEKRFAGKTPEQITETLPVDYRVKQAILMMVSPEGGVREIKGGAGAAAGTAAGATLLWIALPEDAQTKE